MAIVYGTPGPPFNFLGHMSQSQQTAFQTWTNIHTETLPQTQQFYQIRAQQMRKLAGALETYYSTLHEEILTPSFNKVEWQPGPDGYINYEYRNDQQPMVIVSNIKRVHKEPLQRQDDGVFFMNHVRRLIEKQEDLAQQAHDGQTEVPTHFAKLNTLFSQPQYNAALVKDTTDLFQGVSRYRVNQLDPPTPWELAVARRDLEVEA